MSKRRRMVKRSVQLTPQKGVIAKIKKEFWTEILFERGILEIRLDSWKNFYPLACDELLDDTSFIWRGQSCDNWKLEPSLDRALSDLATEKHQQERNNHLKRFQYALRGRRGKNPVQINPTDEKEWWALGQHQGLFTPLLDWTKSPFVSLFFAFHKVEENQTSNRVVFALNKDRIEAKSNELNEEDRIQFISPFIGDNPRLINQTGLFTRAPDKIDVEEWIQSNMENEINSYDKFVEVNEEKGGPELNLIKIIMPDNGRLECLRALNRMNISHLTLFPDEYGASEYCNKCLDIPYYDVDEFTIN